VVLTLNTIKCRKKHRHLDDGEESETDNKDTKEKNDQ
jgi:hypothetical protein